MNELPNLVSKRSKWSPEARAAQSKTMAAAKLRQHLREAAVASGPALAHYKRRQRRLAELDPDSPLRDKSINL